MTDSADQINQSRVVSLLMSFPINFYKLRCTHPAVQVTAILSICRITRSLCFLHFKLD